MERGTIFGLLGGFALALVAYVALGSSPPSPAPVSDSSDVVDALARIEKLLAARHEMLEGDVAAPGVRPQVAIVEHERHPIGDDQRSEAVLAEILAELRAMRSMQERQQPISAPMPRAMNVASVRSAIDLGTSDLSALQQRYRMASRQRLLEQFGRPTMIWDEGKNWRYEPADNGRESLIFRFGGEFVTDARVRILR